MQGNYYTKFDPTVVSGFASKLSSMEDYAKKTRKALENALTGLPFEIKAKSGIEQNIQTLIKRTDKVIEAAGMLRNASEMAVGGHSEADQKMKSRGDSIQSGAESMFRSVSQTAQNSLQSLGMNAGLSGDKLLLSAVTASTLGIEQLVKSAGSVFQSDISAVAPWTMNSQKVFAGSGSGKSGGLNPLKAIWDFATLPVHAVDAAYSYTSSKISDFGVWLDEKTHAGDYVVAAKDFIDEHEDLKIAFDYGMDAVNLFSDMAGYTVDKLKGGPVAVVSSLVDLFDSGTAIGFDASALLFDSVGGIADYFGADDLADSAHEWAGKMRDVDGVHDMANYFVEESGLFSDSQKKYILNMYDKEFGVIDTLNNSYKISTGLEKLFSANGKLDKKTLTGIDTSKTPDYGVHDTVMGYTFDNKPIHYVDPDYYMEVRKAGFENPSSDLWKSYKTANDFKKSAGNVKYVVSTGETLLDSNKSTGEKLKALLYGSAYGKPFKYAEKAGKDLADLME